MCAEQNKHKEFAEVKESSKVKISLGPNGIDAFQNGLPERKLMDLIKDEYVVNVYDNDVSTSIKFGSNKLIIGNLSFDLEKQSINRTFNNFE